MGRDGYGKGESMCRWFDKRDDKARKYESTNMSFSDITAFFGRYPQGIDDTFSESYQYLFQHTVQVVSMSQPTDDIGVGPELTAKTIFEPSSGSTIGAAIAVHRALGPGFMESIYQNALCVALTNRKIPYRTQTAVTISFEGAEVGLHKLDLVVDNEIVVELKAVRSLNEIHEKQVLSYLRASNLKVGLLLNFNAVVLTIKRIVS